MTWLAAVHRLSFSLLKKVCRWLNFEILTVDWMSSRFVLVSSLRRIDEWSRTIRACDQKQEDTRGGDDGSHGN